MFNIANKVDTCTAFLKAFEYLWAGSRKLQECLLTIV